jgi:hypothetical protein
MRMRDASDPQTSGLVVPLIPGRCGTSGDDGLLDDIYLPNQRVPYIHL